MAHKRQAIRSAVEAAITGLTTTGAHVFAGITHDLTDADLPGLVLEVGYEPETVQESSDELDDPEMRLLPVRVTGKAKQKTAILNRLDDISYEVEVAITGNSALSALAVDTRLESTRFELEAGAELSVGSVIMEWVVQYEVDRTAPSA